LAFSKKQKAKMLTEYESWLDKSQAVFMLEFKKMTMKDIDAFRAKVRDTGSEAHVV
jgi:large subunit ribosomal protein L10